MSSQIEEIKNRIDIVELVGSYLRLQKAGANFRALCPFHREKTPSFNVSPARQIWHCFGCGKGGDHFTFLQEIDGVEFPEALKTLAERAGVELRPEDREARSERGRLLALLEEATGFFENQLLDVSPLDYLKSRGLADETIKEFRLGYAPAEWRALSSHLLSKGFKVDEMAKAGVVIKNQASSSKSQDSYYDRFRGRIIFPIFDYNGRVIAFGGRIYPEKENEAKYVNSPETPLYQKSRTIYALHKAKSEVLQKGFCILVEGYMDAIMSHQAGVKNAVAVSGTALTEEQLKILRRLCEKLIAAFDMDSAGEGAAKRGINLALEQSFEVKVAVLDRLKDPAEAVLKDPQIWISAVSSAKHIVDFHIDSILKKHDASTPEAKREFQKSVLPIVLATSDLERAHWVRKISDILSIKEESVWAALKQISTSINKYQSISKEDTRISIDTGILEIKNSGRKALLGNQIIGILAKFPALAEKLEPEIKKALPQENPASLSQGGRAAIFAELFIKEISEAEIELASCQRELKKEYLKDRMRALSSEISKAEKSGAIEVDAFVEEFKKVTEELAKIN